VRSPSQYLWLCLWCVTSLVACGGDKAQKKADEEVSGIFEQSDEELLDAPVDSTARRAAARRAQAAATETVVVLPKAPAKPSHPMSVDPKSWPGLDKQARIFKDKSSIEEGAGFWQGPADTSLKLALKADSGFVYFWLEVKDDVVLDSVGADGSPSDGVVVWLRDPRLESMLRSLPDAIEIDKSVSPDIALMVTPAGRVLRWDDRNAAYPEDSVLTEQTKTKDGYTVMLAVRPDVFPYLLNIPMSEVAFRVEVLDGDDTERPGYQTKLSMLPARDDDSPRYALYGVGGLLPKLQPSGQPARVDGLGFWTRAEAGWIHTSYEVVPQHWFFMNDTADFEASLRKADVFKRFCPASRFDIHLMDSYSSRSGKHRVGLMMCAARKVKERCPKDARSRVFWVHMRPDGAGWAVEEQVDVFGKDLAQCYGSPASEEEPYIERLSMLPLDFINTSTWAVGWQRVLANRNVIEQLDGVSLLNLKAEPPLVGDTQVYRSEASGDERVVSRFQVYFTNVDDVAGLDICEIERLEEQTCVRLGAGCKTQDHRNTLLSHSKMWNPDKQLFEPYMLSKHPNCKADFSFKRTASYLLIQINGRLGLIASPAL
jgi:hypothetical protein